MMGIMVRPTRKTTLICNFILANSNTHIIEDSYEDELLQKRVNRDVKKILNKYLPNRIQPDPRVEIVDFNEKKLEVNVVTKNPVDEATRTKIKQAIIERGYKPNQLYFETKDDE